MGINKKLQKIIADLSKCECELIEEKGKVPPSKEMLESLLDYIRSLLFPSYYSTLLGADINNLYTKISNCILSAFEFFSDKKYDVDEITTTFLSSLLDVKKILITDAQAIYKTDPAAISLSEVFISYPGFYAITLYRIAHSLYILGVPYIPRMICEIAHERTGIDIHPGATIGESFAIDHGTGIVIGETSVIGSNVRIYQGVTIGAKSVDFDNNHEPTEKKKRHPTIKDGAIIYANATILGGDTVIGKNTIIGGNVWITHSVANNEKVYYKN